MGRSFGIVFWLLLPLLLLPAGSGAAEEKQILLIDSAGSSIWTDALHAGMQNFLRDKGVDAGYQRFRLPSPAEAQDGAAPLRSRLANGGSDLVVLCGNQAVSSFLTGQLQVPEGTPLLVAACHGEFSDRVPEALPLTGLFMPCLLADNIRLGLQLLPENARIVVVCAEFPDWEAMKARLSEQEIPPEVLQQMRVLSGQDYTTDELLEAIGNTPKEAVVIFHSWRSKRDGGEFGSYDVLPRLRAKFPGLILGDFDTYLDFGTDGGVVYSAMRLGRQAGELAWKLLSGDSPAELPARPAEREYRLNYHALRDAGITPLAVVATASSAAAYREPPLLTPAGPPPPFPPLAVALLHSAVVLSCLIALVLVSRWSGRRQQRKVNTMLENLSMRVFVVDASLHVLFSHVPDFPPELDLDKKLESLSDFPEEIRDVFSNAIHQAMATGEPVEMDFRLFDRLRHARFVRLPRKNPFRTAAVLWTSNDITELHHVHLETFRLAERFRLTLGAIGDGVITVNQDGYITLINPIACLLTGYQPEEAIGRPLDEVFHLVSNLDDTPLITPLKKALTTGTQINLPGHSALIGKGGARRHIAHTAALIKDSDDKLNGGVLVFRDVTDEHNQRDRLRTNEVLMRNASKIGKFTYFCCDKNGNVFGNIEDDELWPYRDGRPIPSAEWVVPEDLAAFDDAWSDVINDRVPVVAMSYAARPAGIKRYYEMRVERSLNENSGKPEYCGVVHDITAARENELRYLDNLKMLETIMNSLPGYIFVKSIDDDFRYVICNRNLQMVIGLRRELILGSRDQEILPPDNLGRDKFIREDNNALMTDGPLDTIEYFNNPAGKQYIIRMIRNVVTQSDGSRLLLGMGIDISRQQELEQKQAKAIRALNEHIEGERIINHLLGRICFENDFDLAVNEMLHSIGANVGADRAYIFSYTADDYSTVSLEYEWMTDGLSPRFTELRNADISEYRAWCNRLLARENLLIRDTARPPVGFEKEAKFFAGKGIHSVLISGIWLNDRLTGYVGFDFTREVKNFSDSDIHMVRSIVNLYLVARERQRQINRVEDSVALQRQIVDKVTIPLAIIDLDYNIVTANPSTACEYHVPLNKLVGMKCYEGICKEKEPPPYCSMRLSRETGQTTIMEQELCGRKQVTTLVPLVDRQDNLMYFLRSAIDVTDLTRQKQELQKAVELAQAADRAKSYFLASVSHELRTPLNAVIGFSELLQNAGLSSEEQLEYLRSINFAGNALLNLINDVLDLSRLEAGQMEMSAAKTDVGTLVADVVSVFRLKAQEKKLALGLEGDETLLYPLYLDNLRLRQIILNLLGNAVKFTAEGSVAVRLYFVPAPDGGDTGTLTIRIVDTGIGISPENIKRIFEPFVQAGTTRGNRVYEGSGLGLAITRRLVQNMGGEITLESEVGKGSTFTVRLHDIRFDRSGAMPEEPATEFQPPAACRAEAGTVCRVLIIDDVPMNLKLLEAILQKLNIAAVSAGSGPEALKILREDNDFALILTDLWMPGMSGIALAEMLRDNPRTRHIPVIAITADTEISQEEPTVFESILLKPVTVKNLRETINAILRHDRA